MKAVSHRWVFILVVLFSASTAFAHLNICARMDDSVDEEIQRTLKFYKPEIFKSDCDSNVVVEQSANNSREIRIRGNKNGQPAHMVFKNNGNRDAVVLLPGGEFDDSLNQVCQHFLGCEFDYKANSLFYDLLSMSPRKILKDGKICEEMNYPYDVMSWDEGLSSKKVFANNLILESLQCRKSFTRTCQNDFPPLFEKINKANLKVAFVLDISTSVLDQQCFGISCSQFMFQAFDSQLQLMHPSTQVNLYLYNEANPVVNDLGDGRKLFSKPVSISELSQKYNALKEADALISSEVVQLGEKPTIDVQQLNTYLFYLDDLFDQDYDSVYIFSDFLDYKTPARGLKWDSVMPANFDRREKASWKLILRSFGSMSDQSRQFIREIKPDAYLGHVF